MRSSKLFTLFSAPRIMRNFSTSTMPKDVFAQHTKIMASITTTVQASALNSLYKIVKQPDARDSLIKYCIEHAPLPSQTKELLNELSNRRKYPLDALRGLPEKDEFEISFAQSRPERETGKENKTPQQMKDEGYTVYCNTLNTINDESQSFVSKTPSQISLISFKDGVMQIYVDVYSRTNSNEFRRVKFLIEQQDQATIIQLMSGKLSAAEATLQVGDSMNDFDPSNNAKFFCYYNPGNLNHKTRKRVIDPKLQAELEKQLNLDLSAPTPRNRRGMG